MSNTYYNLWKFCSHVQIVVGCQQPLPWALKSSSSKLLNFALNTIIKKESNVLHSSSTVKRDRTLSNLPLMKNQAKKPVLDFPSSQLSKCCLEQCFEISSVSQHVSKLNECVPNVEKCIEYELKTAIKTPKSQLNYTS